MLHYVPVYAPINGVRYKAVCGVYVLPIEHSLEPGCKECRRLLAEENARDADDEAALAALQAMPPGPRLTLRPDNHLDGYTLRSRR